jgi:uncharacterized FlgJ-related protein
MKLYKYCSESLSYKPVSYSNYIIPIILIPIIFAFLGVNIIPKSSFSYKVENVTTVSKNEFNEKKLIALIDRLNIKFPHIVLAQAKLETNNFSSKIFKESFNLFGMKEAKVRINLAKGTQYGHAFYNSWEESVYDYAFYYSTYLHSLKTEQEVLQYLGKSYAEDKNYINKLESIIENQKLKIKFSKNHE